MNRYLWMLAIGPWFLSAAGNLASYAMEPSESPHIVFLVSEDPSNYNAAETIPAFADMLRKEYGCRCTVLEREGDIQAGEFPSARFPGLDAIEKADLVVIFFRRCALPKDQIAMLRKYLADGKPLAGVRTTNHAMAVRGQIAEGHEDWKTFCDEVLGCGNYGYGPSDLGADVRAESKAAGHPILAGVEPNRWHSNCSLYLVKPLDPAATVLLWGSVGDKSEPVAWTRMHGKSRIFYTTLGYPDDFQLPQFKRMLANALFWTMDRPMTVEK